MDNRDTFELFAEQVTSDDLTVEGLDDTALLGTWGSISTFTSASCPASSASSSSSASSAG